jgi:putative membrane protein
MSEEDYTPYIQEKEEMILRDYLAVDRTMLANEASFMSYVRTALTLIAAGATLVKFFDGNPIFQVIGWAFVMIGGWLVIHGYNRFARTDKVLHKIKGEYMEEAKKKSSNGWVSIAIRALSRL